MIYESGAGRLMAVTLATGRTLSIGNPRQLLNLAELRAEGMGAAVLPDGRFVLVQRGREEDSSTINVELNFFDELQSRFATEP